jgi:hypothetical protein
MGDLAGISNLPKYVGSYLDISNMTAFPFIGQIANGPAPTGCAKYEVLMGKALGDSFPNFFKCADNPSL